MQPLHLSHVTYDVTPGDALHPALPRHVTYDVTPGDAPHPSLPRYQLEDEDGDTESADEIQDLHHGDAGHHTPPPLVSARGSGDQSRDQRSQKYSAPAFKPSDVTPTTPNSGRHSFTRRYRGYRNTPDRGGSVKRSLHRSPVDIVDWSHILTGQQYTATSLSEQLRHLVGGSDSSDSETASVFGSIPAVAQLPVMVLANSPAGCATRNNCSLHTTAGLSDVSNTWQQSYDVSNAWQQSYDVSNTWLQAYDVSNTWQQSCDQCKMTFVYHSELVEHRQLYHPSYVDTAIEKTILRRKRTGKTHSTKCKQGRKPRGKPASRRLDVDVTISKRDNDETVSSVAQEYKEISPSSEQPRPCIYKSVSSFQEKYRDDAGAIGRVGKCSPYVSLEKRWTSSDTTRHFCCLCDVTFNDPNKLQRHVTESHSSKIDVRPRKKLSSAKPKVRERSQGRSGSHKISLQSDVMVDVAGPTPCSIASTTSTAASNEIRGQPFKQTEVQPCNQTEIQPYNQIEVQPCNRTEIQPSNQIVVQPCNQAEIQPSHQIDVQPSNQRELQPSNHSEVQQSNDMQVQPSNQREVQSSNHSEVQQSNPTDVQHNNKTTVLATNKAEVPYCNESRSAQPDNKLTEQPNIQIEIQPNHQIEIQKNNQSEVQPSNERILEPNNKTTAQSFIKNEKQPSSDSTIPPDHKTEAQSSNNKDVQPSNTAQEQTSKKRKSQPNKKRKAQSNKKIKSQPGNKTTAPPINNPKVPPSTRLKVQPDKTGAYVCDVCGKGFGKQAYLAQHQKTHSDVRPYLCGVCGKGFKLVSGLRHHRTVHTGERKFPCPHCQRKFSQAGGRNLHAKKCQAKLSEESKR